MLNRITMGYLDQAGKPIMERVRVEDNGANSDNIWYSADTTLIVVRQFPAPPITYVRVVITGSA